MKDKIAKLGASGQHWRSVVRDHWRSLHKRGELRLPLSTAASCLPAQERLFTAAPRTLSTNEVSSIRRTDSVTAVTLLCTISTDIQSALPPHKIGRSKPLPRALTNPAGGWRIGIQFNKLKGLP